jgi:hypothetical protein
LAGAARRLGKIYSMEIAHLFAGVAVTDFAAAFGWYERLFGRPPDMLPQEGEAVWRLSSGGSIYVTRIPTVREPGS